MQNSLVIAKLISSLAFIFYGFSCLFHDKTMMEFKRYGISNLRKLIGVLELLGGLGVMVGFYFSPILLISSAGLTLLMLCGVVLRFKIKDSLILIIPAFALLNLNLFIFLQSIK